MLCKHHFIAYDSCTLHTVALVMQEIRILRSVSFDRNIVQFCGACLQPTDTMMVLEYMAVCHQYLQQCVICMLPLHGQLVGPGSAALCSISFCLVVALHRFCAQLLQQQV